MASDVTAVSGAVTSYRYSYGFTQSAGDAATATSPRARAASSGDRFGPATRFDPDDIGQVREALVGTVLNGRGAARAAYDAALRVLDYLDQLLATVALARDGFVAQNVDAPRGGLDAHVDYLTGLIDEAVDGATVDGVNLVGGGGLVRLGAGAGGAVVVTPQGLDSRRLDLADLGVADDQAAEAAWERVQAALESAGERGRQIAALNFAMERGGAYREVSAALAAYDAATYTIIGGGAATMVFRAMPLADRSATFGTMPRGSVVNLVA